MKNKFLSLSLSILFLISAFWMLGVAGSLELDMITIRQAEIRIAVGVAGLGISTIAINILGKEEKP